MPPRRPQIIGHHLIWTLYGHWLPNDPRGSGSRQLREEKLAPLGPIHLGRKPARLQPTRSELRAFHGEAEPLLDSPRFWIDNALRDELAAALADSIAGQNYTCWACAILSNHAHAVIRKHRHKALEIWTQLAAATRWRLRERGIVTPDHPVWSSRPYKVFLRTPAEVRGRVAYVECNPEKEGLPRQDYDFVTPYNGWPFHKQAKS